MKGRFAFGYATHKDRITQPMIRNRIDDPWREVSWEEAIAYAAEGFKAVQSARVTNFRVSGARQRFQPGMFVHLLARLVQRHPDLDLEVVMLAPDGSEVARSQHRLDKSFSHFVVPFRLTEQLPAGRYRLLLRADRVEVADKAFELVK